MSASQPLLCPTHGSTILFPNPLLKAPHQPSNHPQPPLHSDGRDCGDDMMNDLGRPASEAQTQAGGSWGGASRIASPQHPHYPPAPSTWGPQASGSHHCTKQSAQSPALPQDCRECQTNYDMALPLKLLSVCLLKRAGAQLGASPGAWSFLSC